jgi:chorismate mutase/prephenate dehydrogenase
LEPEKWVSVFTRLLLEQGHTITLFNRDARRAQAVAERHGVNHSISVQDAASGADLILICASTEAVPGLIEEVRLHTKPDAIISEIASFKAKTVPTLKRSGGPSPLSIHPMFGPDIATFQGETIAVVTVNDSVKEVEIARSLFPESKLIPLDAVAHDRCMASILSLPYFMNLVFARVIADGDFALMNELAGPTFEVQMAVTQSIVGESAELTRSLINDNVFSLSLVQKFMDEANHLTTLFESGSDVVDPFLEKLKESMGGKQALDSARELRNRMLESSKKE